MTLLDRLTIANHRGRPVPRVLGLLLAPAAVLAVAARGDVVRAGWMATAALLAVLAAGTADDLAPQVARGIRNHLRALAAGRPTTGIAKLVVIVAAAASVAIVAGFPAPVATTAGAVLIAATTNLANGLDVRPGRALKVMVPLTLLGFLGDGAVQPYLPGLALALVPALVVDLRERAMLGDGGSNLVGFAAGVALATTLPGWALPVAASAGVVLNVLAETVSLSTLIERSRALRAIDLLGRRAD